MEEIFRRHSVLRCDGELAPRARDQLVQDPAHGQVRIILVEHRVGLLQLGLEVHEIVARHQLRDGAAHLGIEMSDDGHVLPE